MLPRRAFLKLGAVTPAFTLAMPWALAAAHGPVVESQRHYVLVDSALNASVQFGKVVASTHRIGREALLTQWPTLQQNVGTHGVISGLTRRSDLPIVMQLVAEHGARIVFEQAAAENLDKLVTAMHSGLAQNHGTHTGALPPACRSMVAPTSLCAPSVNALVGWSIEYGNA